MLTVVLVIITSVAAIVFYANRAVYQLEVDTNTEFMATLTGSIVTQLDDFIDKGSDVVTGLAMQSAVQNALVRNSSFGIDQQLQNMIRNNKAFEAVFMFNMNGKVVSGLNANGSDLRGMDVSGFSFVQGIANGDAAFIDRNLVRSPVSKHLTFCIAAPVSRGGELVGGVVASVDWEKFTQKVVTPVTIGTSGYAYMYDQNMRVIAHPDSKIILLDAPLEDFETTIRERQTGTLFYEYEGEGKVAVFSHHPGTGWIVVLTATERDLAAGATQVRNVLLGIGAVAVFVLAVLVMLLFRRRVITPLGRVGAFAEAVASGDLKAELSGEFRYEIADLARHIATMTGELKSKLAFAQGVLGGIAMPCAVADAEERLTFLNAAMVEAVGREGSSDDYLGRTTADFAFGDASRTTVLAKAIREKRQVTQEIDFVTHKGEKRVFSVVATPLYDLDGKVFGALTMWFDLTEVRMQQTAIEQKNALIEDVAHKASTVSDQVASASEELSAQVEQSSRGADQQRGMAAEAATAIEQMNASVLEVARNASAAAEIAERTRSTARKGVDVVGEVIHGFDRVHSGFLQVDESMKGLGTQAEGISTIVQVIEDIADQTNLLALNAAIEAARAGEAGRGFAVVADEVRKLAEKTMTATKEVGRAVHAIQDSTGRTMQDMSESGAIMKTLSGQTEEAVSSLRDILAMVEETSAQVQSIASAAEEQSAASEQISQSAGDINRIADETADAMTQSASAVTSLARLAGDLQELIGTMR
nr:methyl-accepting chemotaxis protein [Desulfobaculum xiamenense]